ncbi:MAG: hypothetical protein AAFO94_22820, partial [Bacteroidota bacterium]
MKTMFRSWWILIPCLFFAVHFAKAANTTAPKPPIARHHLSDADYVKLYGQLKSKGYRLKMLDGYGVAGKKRFNAVFVHQSGPDLATFHRLSSSEFDAKAKSYMEQGYQLTQLSAYDVKGQDFYAAIWVKRKGPDQVIRHRLNTQQYNEQYQKWKGKGYRLKSVSGYSRNGAAHFAAIWIKKNGPD